MRHLQSLLGLPAVVLLAACSGSSPAGSGDMGTPVATSVQRDETPNVAPGAEPTLVAGNTAFAFALYPGLAGSGSSPNVFYSPYSVSLALAMTYAGAAGDTATQMATALDFTLPPAALHPAFDALDLAIEATPSSATGDDGAPFAINIADSLWGQQGFGFAQPFVDTLAADYGASLRTVDFSSQPGQAVDAIDAWVSNRTNGKIPRLLGLDDVDDSTRFVLVNAVYFNASWAAPFDPAGTTTGAFTRADGSTVQAPRMTSGSTATTYATGPGWQAVELPYSGNTTSMVVVLPDAGAFSTIEQQLSPSFFASVTSGLTTTDVNLTFPKFSIHGPTVSLSRRLAALGMTDAFDPTLADFSGIASAKLHISDVLHQAFVSVDESGTEAAAATAVGGGLTLAGPEPTPVTVDVNRAFFFFIRDIATGTVLFVGREGDPTAE